MAESFKFVKQSITKIDALALATGRELFTDDYTFPEMLQVAFLQSPHAFARIKSIDEREALALDGVVEVLSYKNVPRVMYTTAGQGFPEPSPYDTCLFDTMVRYVGDRVLAVAAESRDLALEALKRIQVDYEVLEPVLDFETAEAGPVIHPEGDCRVSIPVPYHPEKNTAALVSFEVGSVEQGFKDSEQLLESTFYTQYAAHCALEPQTLTP